VLEQVESQVRLTVGQAGHVIKRIILGGALAISALAAALAIAPAGAEAWSGRCCMPWQQPAQLAIAPDGRFAYASDYAVTLALARDPQTGALTVLDSYDAPGGRSTELSPDGRSLYTLDSHAPAVSILARNESTGRLTQLGGYSSADFASRFEDIAFSPDGRHAYLSDSGRDALVVLDRDTATGVLSFRAELRSGDPGLSGLQRPAGIEMSGDGRFLYVVPRYKPGVLAFARADDGALSQIQDVECACSGGVDLTLSPDGTRLYTGPLGPVTYERDASTGLVTFLSSANLGNSGGDEPADAQVVATPDGSGVYVIDHWENRLYQLAATASGLTLVKTYRENADGQGIKDARGLSISPDGAFAYVGSGPVPTSLDAGRIAAFRRDPGTNLLAFASLFEGPFLDGRHPAEQKPPTVTINDGAPFTNDPRVVLTIRNLNSRNTFSVRISNDGGFGAGTKTVDVEPTGRYDWRLATSGPERLPKTVYVRALGFGENVDRVITDDIVLDERPPQLVAVKARAARLRIRARDRLSGVGRMQVTRNRRRPGAWRKFRRSTTYRGGAGKVWVRVRDRAGNRSRWRGAVTGRSR
jgi:6-phosphogluconolactonase (cycloisomerase 2 family)